MWCSGPGTLNLTSGVTLVAPNSNITPTSIVGPTAGGTLSITGSGIVVIPNLTWQGIVSLGTTTGSLTIGTANMAASTSRIIASSGVTAQISSAASQLQGTLVGPGTFAVSGILIGGQTLNVIGSANWNSGAVTWSGGGGSTLQFGTCTLHDSVTLPTSGSTVSLGTLWYQPAPLRVSFICCLIMHRLIVLCWRCGCVGLLCSRSVGW